MSEREFFATAPLHLESLLAAELESLGVDGKETRGGATFSGTLSDAYRVCLWSRVANRVLAPLASFSAPDGDALYEQSLSVPWADQIGADKTIAVDCTLAASPLRNSQYAAVRVKDAIVDQLREQRGVRPDVQPKQPDVLINLHVLREKATLSIDLSGDSLHRRGYRLGGGIAPLKENLAAAILLRSDWPALARDGAALLDPMCGSGTLLIEGAWIAADTAPGLLREYWGFAGWAGHEDAAWQALLSEAHERAAAGHDRLPDIRGYDRESRAVSQSIANIAAAGLSGHVHVERRELSDCSAGHADDRGLLVCNPPYGKRLGADSALPALYEELGQVLRERFRDWRAAVFTGNPDLGKRMGLQAHRMHSLYNGRIECRLLHFEINAAAISAQRRGPRAMPLDRRGPGAEQLSNRIAKNAKRMRRWLTREDVSSYRLYDADLPEYAVAVDVYAADGLRAHVQEYEAPPTIDAKTAHTRLREALGVILDELGIEEDHLYFKRRRQQRGAAQYEKLAATGRYFEMAENGYRLLVNFEDYLDTGVFLDHRNVRKLLREEAAGRDFLNLFAYAGAATVAAAVGGARSTTTVDMSNNYLDWSRRNLRLNGFDGPEHAIVQADCLQWLDEVAQRQRYGLIFLDPPSFSTSARMRTTLDVQRDHVDLITRAAALLSDDGTLIFSSNRRNFQLDRQALSAFHLEELSRKTLPPDFARRANRHHVWHIRKAAESAQESGPMQRQAPAEPES